MAPRPSPSVLWLVIALPAATLAAGIATLALIGGHGLDAVADPVRRTAQVQVASIPGDAEAAAMGLQGRLELTASGSRFVFESETPEGTPDRLWLGLEHPLDAARDLSLPLDRQAGAWVGLGFDPHIGWRLVVAPADGRWRVVSRWDRGADRSDLKPALAALESGRASR